MAISMTEAAANHVRRSLDGRGKGDGFRWPCRRTEPAVNGWKGRNRRGLSGILRRTGRAVLQISFLSRLPIPPGFPWPARWQAQGGHR